MALGKRKHEQQEAWVATTDLPKSPGHPFYCKLNRLLADVASTPGWKPCASPTTPMAKAAIRSRPALTSV